ncbi:MAG: serine/threonine-protein phosphatase [Polyangiaceae bacterium]|nr:serine/threonine-protein phosphatase [Polyangiaceae bacterium]
MSAPSTIDLKIEVAQLSDPGRDPNKQINEDSCGYAQTRFGHLCVLCDGMGGHYGGQEASRRAITTIFEQIDQAAPTATPAQALKYAIEVAARRVYELGGPADNKVRPGSTVVAMLLHDEGLEVAHVGDSRAYVIRSGQIYPLTRDHSMVQAMIDAGFLTEEQAIGHPDANKITRALGMKPEVDVEVRPEPMELFAGDLLLTASDGLTDLALARDILGATRQALASGGIEHACQQLVRMANDRGGHDNITVQIARVVSTAQRKTRTGATHAGEAPSASTTLEQGPLSPHGVPAQSAMAGAPQAQHAAAPMSQRSHPLASTQGMDGSPAHAAQAGPTAIDKDRHPLEGTIPMQTASTAHDGTSRLSHASVPAAAAGGLHLPPVPPLLSPGLQQSLESPAKGMPDYRLDGVGGLQLPPVSTRYVGQQAVQHLQSATPQGMLTPPAPRVQPTSAMTPAPAAAAPGFGAAAPQWSAAGMASPPGAQPAAAGPASTTWRPPPGALAPAHNPARDLADSAPRPSRGSDIDSAGGRTGGNVLFLALAISFVVAVVMLALVWVLFLR